MKTNPLGPVAAAINARQENTRLRSDRKVEAPLPKLARPRCAPLSIHLPRSAGPSATAAVPWQGQLMSEREEELMRRAAALVDAIQARTSDEKTAGGALTTAQKPGLNHLTGVLQGILNELQELGDTRRVTVERSPGPRANAGASEHALYEEY
jgi:hypothetical protein